MWRRPRYYYLRTSRLLAKLELRINITISEYMWVRPCTCVRTYVRMYVCMYIVSIVCIACEVRTHAVKPLSKAFTKLYCSKFPRCKWSVACKNLMIISTYVRMFVHTHVCCILPYTYFCAHTTRTFVLAYMGIQMTIRTYMCTYVRTYRCTYVCMLTYYTFVYICTYIRRNASNFPCSDGHSVCIYVHAYVPVCVCAYIRRRIILVYIV